MMGNATERLQILMGDTLQILDHMKVDAEHEDMLQQIINGLNEQNNKIAELTSKNAAVSMIKHLSQINSMVIQLETNLMEDYQKSTGNQVDQYEQMSLDEQTAQPEKYHDKIDYLSAVKIRENLNKMDEVLLHIMT